MAILNTPLKKIQATCALILAAGFAEPFLPYISYKIDTLTSPDDTTETISTKIDTNTPNTPPVETVKALTNKLDETPSTTQHVVNNTQQTDLKETTEQPIKPLVSRTKPQEQIIQTAAREESRHCLSTDVEALYDDQNHDVIIHFGINPISPSDKIYSYKIDYAAHESGLYADFKGDLQAQMETTHYRPRSKTKTVPKDVQIATFLTERAEGVPQELKYEIIELESKFRKCAKNPASTAIRYTQMVRDTAYENLATQLVDADYPDNMFPHTSNMEKGTYPNTERIRWHINNTATGRENNRLTRGYHAEFTRDTFKEIVVASQKAKQDYYIIARHTTPSYPLNYTSWLAGSGAGENFARLSTTNPKAPIWRIYGETNLAETFENHADAIAKNPAFFYKDQEKKIFRDVAGAIDYLTKTRRISSSTFALTSKEPGFSERISHWESVAHPQDNRSLQYTHVMQSQHPRNQFN